ncbi:MAG: hypothetical protein RBT33_01745 [Candidatus Dojkabacteria bacterium]|jgi:hypothetical protein|nr:hypothetical protein [Candidatus Dojkabacteria bacterium]
MSEREQDQYCDIQEELFERYPNMYLDSPVDMDFFEMSSCEREFVYLLQSRGLVVFREPLIKDVDCREDIDCIPDFFVYNPKTRDGKIVEITMMKENGGAYNNKERKTKARKKRQRESIERSGIPSVYLYREHLERIRKSCCCGLF